MIDIARIDLLEFPFILSGVMLESQIATYQDAGYASGDVYQKQLNFSNISEESEILSAQGAYKQIQVLELQIYTDTAAVFTINTGDSIVHKLALKSNDNFIDKSPSISRNNIEELPIFVSGFNKNISITPFDDVSNLSVFIKYRIRSLV